jgi:hypothetical protein
MLFPFARTSASYLQIPGPTPNFSFLTPIYLRIQYTMLVVRTKPHYVT